MKLIRKNFAYSQKINISNYNGPAKYKTIDGLEQYQGIPKVLKENFTQEKASDYVQQEEERALRNQEKFADKFEKDIERVGKVAFPLGGTAIGAFGGSLVAKKKGVILGGAAIGAGVGHVVGLGAAKDARERGRKLSRDYFMKSDGQLATHNEKIVRQRAEKKIAEFLKKEKKK